jgi:hydrogenase nickel incorporation protein HypA/HybF
MHEMGIANSILDAIQSEARRHANSRPTKVGLRIGEWSGVDTESLRFCFETLSPEIQLDIDYRQRRNLCPNCGAEFPVENFNVTCPSCHSAGTKAAGGDELEIAYIELDEPDAPVCPPPWADGW